MDGGGDGSSVPFLAGQTNLAGSFPVAPASDWLNAPYAQSSTVYIGSTAYTIQRAAIAAGSSGDNTLVGATASKQIRVLSMAIIAASAVSLYFKNATNGPIFGGSTNTITLVSSGGFILSPNVFGWFQTGTVNEALVMNLSGAVAVAGGLTYITF